MPKLSTVYIEITKFEFEDWQNVERDGIPVISSATNMWRSVKETAILKWDNVEWCKSHPHVKWIEERLPRIYEHCYYFLLIDRRNRIEERGDLIPYINLDISIRVNLGQHVFEHAGLPDDLEFDFS